MLGKRGFVSSTSTSSAVTTSTTSTTATTVNTTAIANVSSNNGNAWGSTPHTKRTNAIVAMRPTQSQSQRATQVVESQDFEETTETDVRLSPRRQRQKQPWGRLVSLHVDCKHVDLFLPVIRIGRKRDGQVVHNDIRISGSHCIIYRHAALVGTMGGGTTTTNAATTAEADIGGGGASRLDEALQAVAYLLDLSTNGTYINGTRSTANGAKVDPPPSGGDGLPTLESLRTIDGVRSLNHGDRIALVKTTDAADLQFTYLFEDLSRDLTVQELRQPELQARYEIGNIIGTGAFSQVRVCVDRRSGEQRCVKIVDKRKYGTAPSAAQRAGRAAAAAATAAAAARVPTPVQLGREIDILKRVRHPNVVNVCDVFESPRYIYLVLELARGGELFDRLYESGALDEARARDIFTQLLNAIEYLHHQNIVHRDLKPENILFVDDYSDAVKITDFGLARLVGNAELMQTLCGTPAYVAPEIIRAVQMRQAAVVNNEQPAPEQHPQQSSSTTHVDSGYSKAVDMWSLGIILYALLSGAPPFDEEPAAVGADGNAAPTLFEQIARGAFEMPDYLFGSVSEDAKDLVRRLLVVDPLARLSVAQALAHRWIAGSESSVSQTTTNQTFTQQQQQHQFTGGSVDATAASLDNQGFASPRPKRKRLRVVPSGGDAIAQPQAPAQEHQRQSSMQALAPETPAKRPLAHSSDEVLPVASQPTANGAAAVVIVPDTPPSKYASSAAACGASAAAAVPASIVQNARVGSATAIVIGDSPTDAAMRRRANHALQSEMRDDPLSARQQQQQEPERASWRGGGARDAAIDANSPSVPVPEFYATIERRGDAGEAESGGAADDERGDAQKKLQF